MGPPVRGLERWEVQRAAAVRGAPARVAPGSDDAGQRQPRGAQARCRANARTGAPGQRGITYRSLSGRRAGQLTACGRPLPYGPKPLPVRKMEISERTGAGQPLPRRTWTAVLGIRSAGCGCGSAGPARPGRSAGWRSRPRARRGRPAPSRCCGAELRRVWSTADGTAMAGAAGKALQRGGARTVSLPTGTRCPPGRS